MSRVGVSHSPLDAPRPVPGTAPVAVAVIAMGLRSGEESETAQVCVGIREAGMAGKKQGTLTIEHW
jgi:hypothetical protein